MAIREVKLACTVSYQERTEIEKATGTDLGYARVSLSSSDMFAEPELSMNNGNAEGLGLWYVASDETSHEGRVVAIEIDRGVRIMSDVWADLTFAVVYEPTREYTGLCSTETDWAGRREDGTYPQKHRGACGYFRRIQIATSDFSGLSTEAIRAEVDAPAWLLDAYEGHKAGRMMAHGIAVYDRDQNRILNERRHVERDRWVRVTRGRKVPQGTEGIVFWLGDSQYGTKVGIAVPQEDGTFRKEKKTGRYGKVYESYADVEWTYVKNCQVISGPGGRIL